MLHHRTTRSGGAGEPLYAHPPTLFTLPNNLRTDGSYLGLADDRVLRLANNAAALPSINVYITGMEVTQAIQNTSNSVLLVKNQRRFVRVYIGICGAAVALWLPPPCPRPRSEAPHSSRSTQ